MSEADGFEASSAGRSLFMRPSEGVGVEDGGARPPCESRFQPDPEDGGVEMEQTRTRGVCNPVLSRTDSATQEELDCPDPNCLPGSMSHLSQNRQQKIYAEEAWLFAAFDILIAVTANNLMQQFIKGDGISKQSSFFDFVSLFAPVFHTHWLSQEVLRKHTLPKIKFFLAMFVVLLGILISASGIEQCSSRGDNNQATYCLPYACGMLMTRFWLALVEVYHCYIRYGRLRWVNTHELKLSFFCVLSGCLWCVLFFTDLKKGVKIILVCTMIVDWVLLPMYMIVFHTGILYRQPLASMWETHTIFMVLIMAEGMISVTEYYDDRKHEKKFWYAAVQSIGLMFVLILLYVDGVRAAGHKLFDVKFRRDIFLAALDDCYMAVHQTSRLEYIRSCPRTVADRLADEDLIVAQRSVVSKFTSSVYLPLSPIVWSANNVEQTWQVYALKHMHTFLHVVLAVCVLAMAGIVENYLKSLQDDANSRAVYWEQLYMYAMAFEVTLLIERLLMQKIYAKAYTHAAYLQVKANRPSVVGFKHQSKRFSSRISRDLCDHVKPASYFFNIQFLSVDGETNRKQYVRGIIKTMMDSPKISIVTCIFTAIVHLIFSKTLPRALPEDSAHHIIIISSCFIIQYIVLSSRRQHRNLAYHFDEIQ